MVREALSKDVTTEWKNRRGLARPTKSRRKGRPHSGTPAPKPYTGRSLSSSRTARSQCGSAGQQSARHTGEVSRGLENKAQVEPARESEFYVECGEMPLFSLAHSHDLIHNFK